MDFWRGDAYQAFFKHLDSKGGFYYEVGSLATVSDTPDLVTSAGVMLPCIAWLPRYSLGKTRFISSATWGTCIRLFNIVRTGQNGSKEGAHAILKTASVRLNSYLCTMIMQLTTR